METLSLIMSSRLTNSSSRHADPLLRPFRVGFAHAAAESLVRYGQHARIWGDASPGLDIAYDICNGRERKITKLYRLASDLS
jgi:hypothetical protein